MSKVAAAPKHRKAPQSGLATRAFALPQAPATHLTGKAKVGSSRSTGQSGVGSAKPKQDNKASRIAASVAAATRSAAETEWRLLADSFRKKSAVNLDADAARRLLHKGLPAKSVSDFASILGLSVAEIGAVMGVNPSTVRRLRSSDKVLPTHSADSVLRLLEVHQLACDVFGSAESASQWLNKPHPCFDKKAPLLAAETSYGSQQIKDVLMTIKYGGSV